jgi:Retroviral aspartyl protease
MPHLTLSFAGNGPLVDFYVAVSIPREEALRRAGQLVPSPVLIRGLVDTGASCTCLDTTIISQLALSARGVTAVHTPSTQGTPSLHRQFDIRLVLSHPQLSFSFSSLPVIESDLLNHGIHALIGRDVLAQCLLVYDGRAATFALSF